MKFSVESLVLASFGFAISIACISGCVYTDSDVTSDAHSEEAGLGELISVDWDLSLPLISAGRHFASYSVQRMLPSENELNLSAAYATSLQANSTSEGGTSYEESRHPSIVSARRKIKSQHKRMDIYIDGDDFGVSGSVRFESGKVYPTKVVVKDGVHYQHDYDLNGPVKPYTLTVWIDEASNPLDFEPSPLYSLRNHIERARAICRFHYRKNGSNEALFPSEGGSITFDLNPSGVDAKLVTESLANPLLSPGNGALQSGGSAKCTIEKDSERLVWRENWFDSNGLPLTEVTLVWKDGRIVSLDRDWYLLGTAVVYSKTRMTLDYLGPKEDVDSTGWDPAIANQIFDSRQ